MVFAQSHTVVNRPLCPTLIHDDTTRLVVVVVLMALSLYALYRVGKYFNGN